MINDHSQSIMNNRFVIHDVTKKLVTSSSALFLEEPEDIDELFRQSSLEPRTFKSRSLPGEYKYECSKVDNYCFAWIVQAPDNVDLEFGKLHSSNLSKSLISAKEAYLRNSHFQDVVVRCRGKEVCNNSGDAIVLGSAIYSWLEQIYGPDRNCAFVPKEGVYHLRRQTRSQLPAGTYEVAFIDGVVDPSINATIDNVVARVFLEVEAATPGQSKKAGKGRKGSEDVTRELEM